MLRDYQQRTITDLYAWFEAGSEELLANATACFDPAVNKIRAEFDGRVVG